jgi:hypothetical protein
MVQKSLVAGNSASDQGAGIYTIIGALTVQDSTFYGNTTPGMGGGLYSEEGRADGSGQHVLRQFGLGRRWPQQLQ